MYALVVDDSQAARQNLIRVLEPLGVTCVEAANGIEALDRLVRMPRPALITVNRQLPEMDGFELLGRVRRSPHFRDLTVVMISSGGDAAHATAARALGADDFIPTPFTPAEFISRLKLLGLPAEQTPTPAPVEQAALLEQPLLVQDRPSPEAVCIRLLLVVESPRSQDLLSTTLNAAPGLKVIGVVPSQERAITILARGDVDVVLLDMEPPLPIGFEVIRHLRQHHPQLPIVIFSSLTECGAKATLEALVAGANDYVAKPPDADTDTLVERILSDLVPTLKAVHRPAHLPQPPVIKGAAVRHKPSRLDSSQHIAPTRQTGVIVIAVSTGGPGALTEVLPVFTTPKSPPIVIVQHMPREFTGHLADRLTKFCRHPVTVATDCQPLRNGDVLLAPGGIHVEIVKKSGAYRLAYSNAPPENSCRPSADVLFRSAAVAFGEETLAIVLTGMGRDGLLGSRAIVAAGGRVIAQDEPTSVVWGMPGQVVRAGLADAVLPLDCIGPAIARRIGHHA